MKKFSLLAIISVFILLISAGCGKQVFDGSITGNDEQFIMNYSTLNCTKTHDMKIEKGAQVNVIIENKSGRLDIFISDSKGEKIYKGDNAATGKFSVVIPKTDTYKFSVTGSNAKGSVSFKLGS